MKQSLANNQHITRYINTQINRIIETTIHTSLGTKIKEHIGESIRAQILTIKQRKTSEPELFQYRLQKAELDTNRLKETPTKLQKHQTQIVTT